jgi:hypothetical protein
MGNGESKVQWGKKEGMKEGYEDDVCVNGQDKNRSNREMIL